MPKRPSFYFTKWPVVSDRPIPAAFPAQDGRVYQRSKLMPHAMELIDIMEVGDSVLTDANHAIQVKRCLNYLEQKAKWYNAPWMEFLLYPELEYMRIFRIK